MIDCRIQGREREWKWIHMGLAIRSADERRRKERRSGAGVTQTIRRLWLINADRVALDNGVEDSISGADARLSRTAEDLSEESAGRRRICNPEAWGEAVCLWYECRRNPGIGWIDQVGGRGRIDLGLLTQHECGDLVVFFRPILHQLITQPII